MRENASGHPIIRSAAARLSALGLAITLSGAVAPAAPGLRILISPHTQWGWARDKGGDSGQTVKNHSRHAQLDYYRSLGFSHVTYGLDIEQFNHFVKASGKWVHDRNDGGMGADTSLATAKRDAEARGFRVIPQLSCLSGMSAFTYWLDSTVSEFPGREEFRRFAAAKGLRGEYKDLNFVAAVGDNPAADQFFEAQLGLIKRGWKSDARKAPEYIHIGHDELGYDSVCFVKGGRNRANPATRSELVAAEIDRRVKQVSRILGPSVMVIVYGDSFLPTDLGERYGMTGKPGTGEGGVLWLLRYRYGLQNRVIIMPWNYILEDGEVHYWSGLKYDKREILAYLDRLGFGYIPGPGEQGSGGDTAQNRLAPPFALGIPGKTAACLREWVSAARMRPRLLKGYAHQVFEPYEFCAPDSLCAGFSAPLLAYAAWGAGAMSPMGGAGAAPAGKAAVVAAAVPLPKSVFDGVDFKRSRWEGKWIAGTHYPAP
jgi:hypothetical protein